MFLLMHLIKYNFLNQDSGASSLVLLWQKSIRKPGTCSSSMLDSISEFVGLKPFSRAAHSTQKCASFPFLRFTTFTATILSGLSPQRTWPQYFVASYGLIPTWMGSTFLIPMLFCWSNLCELQQSLMRCLRWLTSFYSSQVEVSTAQPRHLMRQYLLPPWTFVSSTFSTSQYYSSSHSSSSFPSLKDLPRLIVVKIQQKYYSNQNVKLLNGKIEPFKKESNFFVNGFKRWAIIQNINSCHILNIYQLSHKMERFIKAVSNAFRILFRTLLQIFRDFFSFTRNTVKTELQKQAKVISKKQQEVDKIKLEVNQFKKNKEGLKQHPNSYQVSSISQIGQFQSTAKKLSRQADKLTDEATRSEIPLLNDAQKLVKGAKDLQQYYTKQQRNTIQLEIKQNGSQITQQESMIISEQPFSFIMQEDDMKQSQKILKIRSSMLPTQHTKIE